ncbi:MAG TPA: ABC transporter ATP-binding protein [Candidatus Saccharimonadales bacterium]|nr:ABC transporter ATP-binding protein [Candidatus Saccharimonadales bacterium]
MKKTNFTKQTTQLFWEHMWRYPHYVIGLLITTPITNLVYNFLPALISARVLTRLSRGDYDPHQWWHVFGRDLIAYAALNLFGGVVMWRIVDITDWVLEGKVERDLARRIYSHLLEQSANFHANHFGGSLVSQSNKLLGAYIRFADTAVFQVLPLLSSVLWATLILMGRVPQFAFILLGFSVFFIVTSIIVSSSVRKAGALHASAESKQTGYLADSVTNVMAIKSFAGGQFENIEFAKLTSKTSKNLLSLMRVTQRQQAYFGMVNNAIVALSLGMAVVVVSVFHSNIGTIFLILNYTLLVTAQLWTFGTSSLKTYNRAYGDAQEMVEILNTQPEIVDPANPEAPRISQGAINFTHMDFTHADSREEETLFKDLNLTIAPGEKIGLVGHSGSGKTTLTRLLLRFSDIDGGEITIDGQNIAHIRQDDLRRFIAYVPQEPLLFHRSIRENIAYGRAGASNAEIETAARKAYAHEFIERLAQGYDTLVGERGVKLSGGQRQRIVIARAILKDAPILVLDEATSALDSESEKLIQAALWELMKGRTAIVIAHRLSTIQKMDRILVLDHGRIIEQGSHAELLKHKGTYAKLWAHQSGGFIED